MLPPLVKLATSAVPAERKYICLAGAGLSIDAGLPTAWGLMMATASLIRVDDPGDESKDLQTWFLESKYANLSYSQLIGGLFNTTVEQQNFMRKQLRADKPGKAHQLVAELVRRGVLRCVITTNFDDLIEKALVEAGIPHQVIANDDDLKHSEPLIHCRQFRIYKPHGTIGVGRIRNTPADLRRLLGRMENELVRITRDHGLMVVGYSGADESILRVFQRRKQSQYPAFWINPIEPKDTIPPLFGSETFTYVPCKGASACLSDLLAMYGKLAALAPASGLPAKVLAVREAVEAGRPDASPAVREFMESLHQELRTISPVFADGGEFDEMLADSLEKSKGLCTEFASLAKAVAICDSEPVAVALFKGFGKIIEEYYPTPNNARFYEWSFDFWKFVGHELLVTYVAMLIREERWELVTSLLGDTIYLSNGEDFKPGVVTFDIVSQYVQLIDEFRNRRIGRNRISLRSEMLSERHSDGDLAKAIPADEFMDADFFLFLRSEAGKSEPADFDSVDWIPWSVIYMKKTGPRFLLEATSKKQAERLVKPLGVHDVEALRTLVKRVLSRLSRLFNARAVIGRPFFTGST